MSGDFVDKDKTPTIRGSKLSIGVEKLDAVDGSVWGEVDFYLIAQPDRLHFNAGRLPQPQIRDVSTRIIAELHLTASNACSKIFDDYDDHKPVVVFPGRKNLDLLHMVATASPECLECEIPSESFAAKLSVKPLSFPNCRGNLLRVCSSLKHTGDGLRVEFHYVRA
jgi:hypothetical protein